MEREAVTISVVGTESTQGGGVAPTPSGTLAVTPEGQPDLIVNVVTPAVAILVRFVNSFLTSFVGLITAAGIGVAGAAIPGADFGTVVQGAALASLAIAGVETLKNIVTIFGRLEGKYPLATGSI